MLNQEVNYVYELQGINIHRKKRYLIKSKIKPKDMKNLIFYIQYKYQSIIPQSVLTENEIKEVLVKCYEVENINDVNVDEIINLQENFKRYFNNEQGKSIIKNFSIYEVNGLIEELRRIVYVRIEMWR